MIFINLVLKQACKDAGVTYCERVDEQDFDGFMIDRIYNQMAKADLIISDLTGRNPNVFYETGFAHGIGKKPILLTQKAEDIPFDLKHYPHIIYNGEIVKLQKELEKKVRWRMQNLTKEAIPNSESLEYYIFGQSLTESKEFTKCESGYGAFSFKIDYCQH